MQGARQCLNPARPLVRPPSLSGPPTRCPSPLPTTPAAHQVAELVGTSCQRLTAANVPHNLFIADCGARVFLFPNCFAERKARGLIPEGAHAGLDCAWKRRPGASEQQGLAWPGMVCQLRSRLPASPTLTSLPHSPSPTLPSHPLRLPADVLETQVDPAAWEIAGHIVLKRQQDYDAVTQDSAWRLLELASCSEERFAEVACLALDGLL